MDKPGLRQGVLEHQTSWWSVRPETLGVIAERLANPMVAELQVDAEVADTETNAGVAVIPLQGLITPRPSLLSILFGGGGGLAGFRSSLRLALASDQIGSILIDVDSPGGSTDLITETAAELRAARGKKPITAIANTMAASGAYWIASQADELVVTPSGEVGSIGVFALHWDESGLNEQLGLKPTYISAGKFKTEGNPDEPLSEDARKAAQQTIDEFYGLFVRDVAKGRAVSVDDIRAGFGEGRMVTAKRAVDEGMADRVASFEDTLAGMVKAQGSKSSGSAAHQTSDKPVSKEIAEEGRARIARLTASRPVHQPPKEE